MNSLKMETSKLLNQISLNLHRHVRLLLQQKFGRMFYPYVMLGAASDFKEMYMGAFCMYLRDFSGRLAEKIAFAAMNLAYTLKVHLDMCPGATLADIQGLATRFIDTQLEDYYDWSADLSAH